ncbi:hypothetical protein ABVK25_012501 [Lepraria finkii]|uniref:Malonyl-CoA:ACP transacylase (MAT) domain-containing protein n=1 Tax=Lepraria finkii TaxID=1340010 RepID=A0ABR4AGW9_9LECA
MATDHHDLASVLSRNSSRVTEPPVNANVTFIFTGQGAQWSGMGRELISTQSTFKDSLLRSEQLLQELGAPWSLIGDILLSKACSGIEDGTIAQPATTALQIALVDFIYSVGIHPKAVLGHSSGEIAAAYAAGALSHKAAISVSYHRGCVAKICKRVLQTNGAMIAVGLGEVDIQTYIAQVPKGIVSVACVNSPSNTTVSGNEAAILDLQRMLNNDNIFNRKLKVNIAYHSPHLQVAAGEYGRLLEGIDSGVPNPAVRFFSSVTATEKAHRL